MTRMKSTCLLAVLAPLLFLAFGCDSTRSGSDGTGKPTGTRSPATRHEIVKSDAEWKSALTANQFAILREKGTEPPFRNEYFDNHQTGMYVCAADANPLYSSEAKFESGTGWPSFWKTAERDRERGPGTRQRRIADRSALPQVRRAPWSRLRRWTATNRQALLHEFGCDEVRSGKVSWRLKGMAVVQPARLCEAPVSGAASGF